MKHTLTRPAALLAGLLLILSLAACKEDAAEEITLHDYDTGSFVVGIPEGWVVRHAMFGPDDPDPDNITLFKDPKSEDPMDLLAANTILIIYAPEHNRYYGDDMEAFKKSVFADAEDMDPAVLSKLTNYHWDGFWGNYLYEQEVLLGREENEKDYCFEVTVRVTNVQDERIMSAQDPLVQAIINSLRPNS